MLLRLVTLVLHFSRMLRDYKEKKERILNKLILSFNIRYITNKMYCAIFVQLLKSHAYISP